MFDQKAYVNEFIKSHYRTVKVRVKKDDRLVLAKFSQVPNLNQYILDLVSKDIQKNRSYPFIDNSILIEFDLSKTMTDLVNEAELADFLGDYGLYMNLADAIDSQGKKETTHHIIRESQWKALTKRYHL